MVSLALLFTFRTMNTFRLIKQQQQKAMRKTWFNLTRTINVILWRFPRLIFCFLPPICTECNLVEYIFEDFIKAASRKHLPKSKLFLRMTRSKSLLRISQAIMGNSYETNACRQHMKLMEFFPATHKSGFVYKYLASPSGAFHFHSFFIKREKISWMFRSDRKRGKRTRPYTRAL